MVPVRLLECGLGKQRSEQFCVVAFHNDGGGHDEAPKYALLVKTESFEEAEFLLLVGTVLSVGELVDYSGGCRCGLIFCGWLTHLKEYGGEAII